MASTSAVAMTVLPSFSTVCRRVPLASSTAFFNPLKASPAAATVRVPKASGRFGVRASSDDKGQVAAGLTAVALAAAFLVPDIAEAAQPGISPSLKNFLLSIVSGGVVLVAIAGAVIGVSNFDPVKRT